MTTSAHTLTASELFEGLETDTFSARLGMSLVGMVKKSTKAKRAIEFSLGESCAGWVTIPIDRIEGVRVLRMVSCRDHSHPLVEMGLKAAESPEARLFASLLQGVLLTLNEVQVTAYARQAAVDEWGDPVCGPGTRKKCYPAVCPNPSGRGTIWCTKCQCEPVFNPHPEELVGAFRA